MPLTPRFSLKQTPSHVHVEISVPSFRLSEGSDGGMEVVLTGENNSEFHFYAKPYLLKLNFFPNGFVDRDESIEDVGTAKYDPSEQTVVVPLLKLTKRQRQQQQQQQQQRQRQQEQEQPPPFVELENDNNDDEDEDCNASVNINVSDDDNDYDDENENDNHWPDLDLTARMIQPKEIPKKWLHAVVDGQIGGDPNDDDDEDESDRENTGDSIRGNHTTNNSNTPNYSGSSGGIGSDGYGFSNIFRNIFTDYCRSGLAEEMLQLEASDPEHSTIEERRDERLDHESTNFVFDRYLADLELSRCGGDGGGGEDYSTCEDYLYPMVMSYQPWWRKNTTTPTTTTTTSLLLRDLDGLTIHDGGGGGSTEHVTTATTIFSDDEKLLLSTIPYPLLPKNLLLVKEDDGDSKQQQQQQQQHRLWCGLLELVLAYVYDHLATMGDPTVESAWTIAVLSPGLSWLDSSPSRSVRSTLKTFLRRLLVYPYWRNAEGLGKKVLAESLELMQSEGIHGITKALLQIRAILDKSEVHYLGNKLLVDPYLYWIQNLKQQQPQLSQESQTKGGNHKRATATSTSSRTSGLDRILSELAKVVGDDASFEGIVESVEASLGIDSMMEDYFGNNNDDEEEEEEDTGGDANSSASEPDSESSFSDEDESTDCSSCDVCDDKEGEENKTGTTQLLDDQIGNGTADTKDNRHPSILYCVGDNEPRSSAAAAARPLIAEVRSETRSKKNHSLIQEM